MMLSPNGFSIGTGRTNILRYFCIVCGILIPALTALAEEGGTGHYLPGSFASFIDGTPTDPGFIASVNSIYYDGSFDSNTLPIAGVAAADISAEIYALAFTFVWTPDIELMDGLSYAMAASIPFLDLTVSGEVIGNGGGTTHRSDSVSGLGDIFLIPVMLNYKVSNDLHLDFRLGIYAPTGDYKVGRLANLGKNYWTFEPTIGLLYFGKDNGLEASVYAGIDLNTENTDTNYQTGSQIHIDGTLAQHLPIGNGLAGVGVSAYWYEQVEGDSGSGATFGSFRGRTVGIGPVISYAQKVGKTDLIVELKWLKEVETRNRLEGDYIWLKFVVKI